MFSSPNKLQSSLIGFIGSDAVINHHSDNFNVFFSKLSQQKKLGKPKMMCIYKIQILFNL